MTRRAAVRMLDANANRALEGLRVCEEIIRFGCEAPSAFHRLRALRHALARAMNGVPVSPRERVGARESRRDIGRRAAASRVASLERLLLINFQRAKEALRVLEECSRMVAPRHTAGFQRLRFRTYEVEREILLGMAAVRHHRPGRSRRSRSR